MCAYFSNISFYFCNIFRLLTAVYVTSKLIVINYINPNSSDSFNAAIWIVKPSHRTTPLSQDPPRSQWVILMKGVIESEGDGEGEISPEII